MDEAAPTNETAVDSSAEIAGSAAAAPAAGGKTFDKDNQQFLEDIYKNLVKWLDRAGLNDKCTPLLLRAKLTNDMQFIPGELDSLEAQHVLHKMIIRWWKAAGEKRHEEENKKSKTAGKDSKVAAAAASSSSSSLSASKNDVKVEKTASSASREAIKELYQKLRSLAKETNNQALLADVNTLESTEAKVTELRKRFLERAKVNISKSPTEQELKDIRETMLKGGSGDDQPAQKKVKVES